jgi:hypothetical protein
MLLEFVHEKPPATKTQIFADDPAFHRASLYLKRKLKSAGNCSSPRVTILTQLLKLVEYLKFWQNKILFIVFNKVSDLIAIIFRFQSFRACLKSPRINQL